MTHRSKLMLLLVVGVLATACSDDPLAEIGKVTNEWIGAPAAGESVLTTTTLPVVAFHAASDVSWVNDALADDEVLPEESLAAVWQRREAGNKYVQAARMEIAGALPGIEFPELLPDDIEFISSQLLFDGDGTLANDYLAVFGMWTAEPYTVSRSVGQRGILWVTTPDPGLSGCEHFSHLDLTSCETVVYEGMTAWRLQVGGSNTLGWLAGDYQYELFHRSQVDGATALRMAAQMIPLEAIEPAADGNAGVAAGQ